LAHTRSARGARTADPHAGNDPRYESSSPRRASEPCHTELGDCTRKATVIGRTMLSAAVLALSSSHCGMLVACNTSRQTSSYIGPSQPRAAVTARSPCAGDGELVNSNCGCRCASSRQSSRQGCGRGRGDLWVETVQRRGQVVTAFAYMTCSCRSPCAVARRHRFRRR